MITLTLESVDFKVNPGTLWDPQRHSGEELSGTDLHYTVFHSLVSLQVEDRYIIGPKRRVPLFDFLVCVSILIRNLRQGLPASITFTESADVVRFTPTDGTTVKLVDTGGDAPVTVELSVLLEVVTAFHAHGCSVLLDNVPRIVNNRSFGKLSL